jgi:hypothetical protein
LDKVAGLIMSRIKSVIVELGGNLIESGFNVLTTLTKISIRYFNGFGHELFFYLFYFFPYSALHAIHLGSVVLSGFSLVFWHARLLTASHVFVMDY